MTVLYVVEQGAVVQKEGERLVVRKEGRPLASVPVFKVDSVVVFGGVQVSTQAIALLLGNGVELAFMSMDGRLKGRLMPAESRNVLLRLQQYQRYHDADFRLKLGRAVVRGKLSNARALIVRYARNHPGASLAGPLRSLEDSLAQVDSAADLESLRGIEGRGAAAYFTAFARMVTGELRFSGRSRRPPGDPVNALLSLGYSLLTHEMFGAVAARGLDPYLGFYHDVRYGRPALALDLVEEFRAPVVDRTVLSLVNRRVFGPEDFEEGEEGGVFLTKEAFRRFLAAYEERLSGPGPANLEGGWRAAFREQVRRLVRTVRWGEAYEPLRVEG
ncbi:MAG: CRISPR-associated endonuclease Cas1 [Armatimonadota bacterium]|nr:CRISPR-associated endonuclease Cas1 [Armatimonadota bacterium]MDR7447329.1 CRISPR-associated endonuclease Cas1 [Armatimonadota bacterium]MDR7566612.1 CRISPR-associated endonuclease Cas1 [Armatimonadota bacterium]MDR7602859.1 CRISPR-associated endonuclease Cas1 [Armatimonadota bacterium]MDR7610116.1 CRISPR-associated endonuclease Cas1 [Armatimonadota bacterium]